MKRLVYNILLHAGAAPVLLLYYGPKILLRGKYRRSIYGKLGSLPDDIDAERLPRPRIWFHAVSVGEVNALQPLVRETRELLPDASILVSTGTETGQDTAKTVIPEAKTFFLPLDFPEFMRKVVQRITPDVFVLMETELWPNLLHYLKASGADIVLANGRISDRSYPRYRFMRSFFADTLAHIDLFLMASELDAQRIEKIGAQKDRILVTGNTKFDAVRSDMESSACEYIARLANLAPSARVLVAGSTHAGEEEILLDAYTALLGEFPDLVLILAPRHVERSQEVANLVSLKKGLPAPFLRSAADCGAVREKGQIVVWDRTGELKDVYSAASVVFVGGSLVPKGGQNIIEPAIWEKTVMFGPSMEDFRDARDILLRCGAAIEVQGAKDIADAVWRVFNEPDKY
ncbi:MAG: 3-deoxy-D-manno-octulosonic acid transferase, partial [Desulfomonilaceae bacterium]